MRRSHLVAVLACGLLLPLAGCRCNKPSDTSSLGEIAFVYDQDGTTLTEPDGLYDFGKVGMGTTKQLVVTVENRGTGPLDVESIEKIDGDNVKVGDVLDQEPPVFRMEFNPITLGAGSSLTFAAEFDAPMDAAPTVDHAATVLVHVGNTAAGGETAHLQFKGTAVSGTCMVPTMLDFGAVELNDTVKLTIPLLNSSPLTTTASVGAIESGSGDDKSFGLAPESITGDVSIMSGSTRDVVVEFRPSMSKDYLALIHLKPSEQCPDVAVTLIGTGVGQVLTCTPNPLDFGYVTPGLSAQGSVTLLNGGISPVHVTGLKAIAGATATAEYQLLGSDSVIIPAATRMVQNGGSVRVPGSVDLQVKFSPSVLGPRLADLTGATDQLAQTTVACPLLGRGGGPDIDLKPTTLAMGAVPYFASAPKPFFVTRKVTVQNVGTAPMPADAKANLHFGHDDGHGNFIGPYWKLTANTTDSTADEICVGRYDDVNFPAQPCRNDLDPSYDPMVGIVASGSHALYDIPIRVTPKAAGLTLDWTVTFYSNDPDEGQGVDLHVTAVSTVLPACQYVTTPAVLNFGLVSPPGYLDLTFTIKNQGLNPGETCLITDLELAPLSDAMFSLPAGPISQQMLQPQESVAVVVRAWPQGAAGQLVQNGAGIVQFGISSPLAPSVQVPLSAQVATGCLVITPSDFDFGTVKNGCSSSVHTFNIYNACLHDVTLNSFGFIPGSSEFSLSGVPSFSAGTVFAAGASAPQSFALAYTPTNLGSDTGAFKLTVTQNGQNVDYVVALHGNGDLNGRDIDTFVQDAKPKADILLVIDNSCSMADKQTQLAMNFASLIHYAQAANVDYHLGVITTDLLDQAEEGILKGDFQNPKVLTPATPNVETLFATKVRVDINGGNIEGIVEPAVKALTAPLITLQNAGFLRIDAVLAVIGISDAGDQSPLPVTVYESQLRNIKGAQHPNQFTYNRIGPFSETHPASCAYDDFTDTTYDDYLVQVFNGVKEQICTLDWATALENLGTTAFGYRTTFYLTAMPDLSGGKVLTVTMDKGSGPIALPAVDPVSAGQVWNYDQLSNAIVFQPLYVPEPGWTLTVAYDVACL